MSSARDIFRNIFFHRPLKPWTLIFLLFLFLYSDIGCSQSQIKTDASPDTKADVPMVVEFYRGPLNHLSAIRRGNCPMVPTCSEYAELALSKHGPILGWMMTMDRLLRCGRDEVDLSKQKLIEGKWKAFDPVENNDFWWARPPSNLSLPNFP